MQIPGTYPVRFKVRPGIDRVAAIKAIREALDPTRIGLKEAKEGFDAGVIYAAPDMVPALLAALGPLCGYRDHLRCGQDPVPGGLRAAGSPSPLSSGRDPGTGRAATGLIGGLGSSVNG